MSFRCSNYAERRSVQVSVAVVTGSDERITNQLFESVDVQTGLRHQAVLILVDGFDAAALNVEGAVRKSPERARLANGLQIENVLFALPKWSEAFNLCPHPPAFEKNGSPGTCDDDPVPIVDGVLRLEDFGY